MVTKHISTCIFCITLLFGLMPAARSESELLFFFSADNLERGSVSEPSIQEGDFTPTIDSLFTYSNGQWRILGEYFLTDDEAELERIQIGYDYRPDSTLWFGRFHQPVSFWNFRYHHGAYLQPSVSKPSIENWEDDGGIIPAHVAGLMLSSTASLGESSRLEYSLSLGLAPVLDKDELLPLDFLSPGDNAGAPAIGLNINYAPNIISETSVGLIAGYAEIEATRTPLAEGLPPFAIRQSLVGAQFNWENDDWQFLAAAYYVDNKTVALRRDAGGWFLSGYAQVLRQTSQNTNAYLRLERTGNASRAGYLALFSHFIINRDVAGFRFDFTDRQAVAIEASQNEVLIDDYVEVRLQWSAAFP